MSAFEVVVVVLAALACIPPGIALLNAIVQRSDVSAILSERSAGSTHGLDVLSGDEIDQLSTSAREHIFGTRWPNPWGRSTEGIGEKQLLVYANLLRDRASLVTMSAEILVLVSSAAFGASVGKMTFAGGPDFGDSATVAALAALLLLGASVLVKVLLVPEWSAAAATFESIAVHRAALRDSEAQGEPEVVEPLRGRLVRAFGVVIGSRRKQDR